MQISISFCFGLTPFVNGSPRNTPSSIAHWRREHVCPLRFSTYYLAKVSTYTVTTPSPLYYLRPRPKGPRGFKEKNNTNGEKKRKKRKRARQVREDSRPLTSASKVNELPDGPTSSPSHISRAPFRSFLQGAGHPMGKVGFLWALVPSGPSVADASGAGVDDHRMKQ
jgi:hypothetical protein